MGRESRGIRGSFRRPGPWHDLLANGSQPLAEPASRRLALALTVWFAGAEAAMEFRILGPIELRVNDVPLPLGGPKQRALLALLFLRSNTVVPRDVLIDALWGEQPPATAAHTLDAYIHRLRKLLRGEELGEPRLLTRAPGYLLRVAPDELDVERFQRLLEEGRRALGAEAPERAAECLAAALALWRGPPLADLDPEPSIDVEVRRLEDLRLVAVEERIEAELALGRDGALVPELESLLMRFPL